MVRTLMARHLSCCMTMVYTITWWCAQAVPPSNIMTVVVVAAA